MHHPRVLRLGLARLPNPGTSNTTLIREVRQLALEWFDSIDDEDVRDQESEDSFYCPYTNAAQCALLTKGWQPQELCLAIECDQVKLVHKQHQTSRQDKAA